MSEQNETVLQKLREARVLLDEASDEAGMGTSLMIESIGKELNGVIERFQNINNATENEVSSDDA